MFNDHRSLNYLLNQNKLHKRQKEIDEVFKDYDFKFMYYLENKILVEDALSRKTIQVSNAIVKNLGKWSV